VRALAAGLPARPTALDTVVGRRVLRMGGTTIEVLDLGRAHTGAT
jgi:hypothetical protein